MPMSISPHAGQTGSAGGTLELQAGQDEGPSTPAGDDEPSDLGAKSSPGGVNVKGVLQEGQVIVFA